MSSKATREKTQEIRATVAAAVGSGDVQAVMRGLRMLWRMSPDQAAAGFICANIKKIKNRLDLIALKVAVLRSFTVEPIIPLLTAEAFLCGIDLQVHIGEFNAFAQEILNSESSVYKFQPDICILAWQTPDVAPELLGSHLMATRKDSLTTADEVGQQLARYAIMLQENAQCAVIAHNLDQPIWPSDGLLDGQTHGGESSAIRRANSVLQESLQKHTDAFVLDYDSLVARYGRSSWYDSKRFAEIRLPIRNQHLLHLANEWARFIQVRAGKVCKALICDLDNTLWGGVLGEVGAEGILLGVESPGVAYLSLQRAILDLHARGIILGICSKNNHDIAWPVVCDHPQMLLRAEHFAAHRINWQPKTSNLLEIAAELNIGIDSIAFMDDSPVECDLVRHQLPEVTVIELDGPPFSHVERLRSCRVFERLTFSSEDQRRSLMYAQQRQRSELADSSATIDDFFASLEMRAEFRAVSADSLSRIAQLTQKTNQFNMTTKRYTETDIETFQSSPAHHVFHMRLEDRFGDNGIIAVVILKAAGEVWEIDTFLMSCRVIGRTVETAMLALVSQQAIQAGATTLRGVFIPTKKNEPASKVYAAHGFSEQTNNGTTHWDYDLSSGPIEVPKWIEVEAEVR